MDQTVVIFRRWKAAPKTVLAIFPEDLASSQGPWFCGSYEHIGQHGAAQPDILMTHVTLPARLDEPDVQELKRELESEPYCYRLIVRQRLTRRMDQKRVDTWQALRKEVS